MWGWEGQEGTCGAGGEGGAFWGAERAGGALVGQGDTCRAERGRGALVGLVEGGHLWGWWGCIWGAERGIGDTCGAEKGTLVGLGGGELVGLRGRQLWG